MPPTELLTEAPQDGPDAPRRRRRHTAEPDSVLDDYADEQMDLMDRVDSN